MAASEQSQRGFVLASSLAILYALLPVWWVVSLSFKPAHTIGDGRLIPREWTLDNYRGVFRSGEFVPALINSIGIASIATALSVGFATLAAYALARLEFPFKRALMGLSLMIAMFPAISLVSPLFDLERKLGLFDTWLGLILPYITFSLPLAIYTLTAFFREIPRDLERAAKMDGASPIETFVYVIAPLSLPGVVTSSILVFIFCWNDFLFSISLTSTLRSRTVPAALAFFTGSSRFEEPTGSIAAAAVIITIPIVVFVLLFQRRIVSGLTSGAVKG